MDAIKFIISQHNIIRKTFAIISKKNIEKTKHSMFDKLCKDLIKHETMEQKIWYPYLQNNMKIRTVINHLVIEEKKAEKSIKSLKIINAEEKWEKNFTKLMKDVTHHANEEENKLFPKVRNKIEKNQLNIIGNRLENYMKKTKTYFL